MNATMIRGSLFLGLCMIAAIWVGYLLLEHEAETVWQNPRCEVLADSARPDAPVRVAHCIIGPLPLRDAVRVR